ncbi:MAG: SH3 domain-containing protein [Proteobacteria bacterium]|nr:SH3 domain-containing protein [Pseudomonadota bacterium]
MKRKILVMVLAAFLSLFGFAAHAADALWVASEGAKLKADHSASSETLATVPMGTRVTVLESESRWYRVRTASGGEGWIYRGKLSDTAPEKETGDTGNLLSGLGGSNISADEAQTSRSIRGLSKETEQYAKNTKTPEAYKQALDQVLAIRVTDEQLGVFLRAGKIGEYAP